MELSVRPKNDCFLPDGAYSQTQADLRQLSVSGRPIVIVYAFDFSTVMLPYVLSSRYMMPAGVRLIGSALAGCGFDPIRIVLQQWTPNFDVRRARLGGKPIEMLCISSMQIHSAKAIELVRQAHELGPDRPLIVVGGPKAIYEPHAFFAPIVDSSVEADVAVLGEEYILLQMLQRVASSTGTAETLRQGFDRARRQGLLESVPGLMYRHPDTPVNRPTAIHTGVQRIVRDLDELPQPMVGFKLVEKPHRRKQLQPAPLPLNKLRRNSVYAALVISHGCRYNCPYCPIPAYNQRTWRTKSPQRLVDEIQDIHRQAGITKFFGTDDNFFNKRATIEGYFGAMARAKVGDKTFGEGIAFSTEATQFDVYKNRDILPLARRGGLRALYFGIEDLEAKLVNKGQTPARVDELFKQMCDLGISPMVMMMHYEDQPMRTRDSLVGLLNQVDFLQSHGAVSYQCTIASPALGTRALAPALEAGTVFRKVAGKLVPDACYDGNHVVAFKGSNPWTQQWNVLRAYWRFYNPVALATAMLTHRDSCVSARLFDRVTGLLSLPITAWRYHQWVRKLKQGPTTYWGGVPQLAYPVCHVGDGPEPGGLIQSALTDRLPNADDAKPSVASITTDANPDSRSTTSVQTPATS